jgi:predicted RNA-binding Zn-ribbon protein involved in translation (DUF1610 family)
MEKKLYSRDLDCLLSPLRVPILLQVDSVLILIFRVFVRACYITVVHHPPSSSSTGQIILERSLGIRVYTVPSCGSERRIRVERCRNRGFTYEILERTTTHEATHRHDRK